MEGRPPFGTGTGNVLALLARVGRGGVPRPQRAGPLTDLLRSLTADDPGARPTAAQAHAALCGIADARTAAFVPPADPSGTPAVAPQAPRAPGRRRRDRGPLVAAVLGALVLVAGVVTAVTLSGSGPAAAVNVTSSTAGGSGPAIGVGDAATADPCSLLQPAVLEGFGSVALDPHNVAFAGCRADILRPDGTSVAYTVTFENEVEVGRAGGAGREEATGYTILSYPAGEGYCERRVVLADANAVLVGAVSYDDTTSGQDLCPIAEAGASGVLTQLAEQGIGTRGRPGTSSPLAGVRACDLLTSVDLAVVPGVTAPRARFADWGCEWGPGTDGGNVSMTYYRGYPLGAADGEPASFAGHPGTVLARPGNCWVQFVQHRYIAGGSERIEAVWVTYYGSDPQAEMCRAATALAAAAAAKLPAPS